MEKKGRKGVELSGIVDPEDMSLLPKGLLSAVKEYGGVLSMSVKLLGYLRKIVTEYRDQWSM